MRRGRQRTSHPDRRLLVFWVTLPCPACSRILCFSSSRWPLVVSIGTSGVLPGPLWLLLSSGTGVMVFFSLVIISLRYRWRKDAAHADGVPQIQSSFGDGPKDQTSDAQLRIGESRDSGFIAARCPGMT